MSMAWARDMKNSRRPDYFRGALERRVEEREQRLIVAVGSLSVEHGGVARYPAVFGGIGLDHILDACLGQGFDQALLLAIGE